MKRIYLSIFLVSGAVLVLEVALTRLFSIYLSYHFAFMVISIAMLGIGSAGTVLSLYPFSKGGMGGFSGIYPRLSLYAMFAGVSILLGYIVSNHTPFDPVKLSWDRMQVLYVALYCFILSVPFFFSGMLIATAFSVLSEKSERIDGSDLLGAGTGSLVVLGILHFAGPEYGVLTASLLCFTATFVAGGRTLKTMAVSLTAAIIMFCVVYPESIQVRLSPYKNLSLSLKYPGAQHLKTYYNAFSRIDTLKSPAVRFAPGLSLTYLKPLPEQIGLSIDGGEMNAVTFTGDKEAVRFLQFLPSAFAYEIKSPAQGEIKVLVLEPKGGLQVLMAEHYHAQQVHKIESNPLLVQVIREDFREFSGNIYGHDTWTGLGRSLLRDSQIYPVRNKTPKDFSHGVYDIIDMPMTGVSPAGSFGITEDYRFTVEAFQKYFRALKENGFISISLYIIPPPRTELRILGTVVDALRQEGVSEVSGHVAAIRSWDSITIIAKKSAFIQEEIRRIKAFAKDRRFDLVHYPGMSEEESNVFIRMPTNEYFRAFESIMNPDERQGFMKDYLFNIKPVHDENPFFHYYLKTKNLKAIYEVMGQKWQYFIEEGYLLPVVLLIVFVLSAIMIVFPVMLKIKTLKQVPFPTLFYFGMLGIGFMFVEITMIQKSILTLVNPAYAVATVLTAILMSSGIGSLLSLRIKVFRVSVILPALCCLIIIYSLILPKFLVAISPFALAIKLTLVFLAMIPLGIAMGIPFPAGIKLLGQGNRSMIPWAWAINGFLSVLAPIMTIMIAMTLGFRSVLWLGAAAYLIAFFALRSLMK
jgi:hypothetical protein